MTALGGYSRDAEVSRLATTEHVRNLALEQAILVAEDPTQALAVYGDWLQDQGDVRGEWVTLQQRLEASPSDVRLKSASIRFLDEHREALLGDAARFLGAMHVGWRGGFVDELRLFGDSSMVERAEAVLTTVLAHPSARFVRCVTLGEFTQAQLGQGRQGVVDALASSAPELLTDLMLFENDDRQDAVDLTPLEKLPRLERLSLCGAGLKLPQWPNLRALSMDVGSMGPGALAALKNGAFPAVEDLTLMVDDTSASRVIAALAGVPNLRRLRVLHLRGCDKLVGSPRLKKLAKQLELLDLSYGDLGVAGIDALDARFADLAMFMAVGGVKRVKRFASRGERAVVSRPSPGFDGYRDREWLTTRFDREGRDALRLVPNAGTVLYSIGTRLFVEDPPRALPYLAASLTLPAQDINISAWANFSIGHWRDENWDVAELAAREGLLRFPGDPNLFACLLDPLRKAGRLDEALAAVPAALACVASPPPTRTNLGRPLFERQACLLDCVLTLVEGQKEQVAIDAVRGLAAKVPTTPKIHAVLALAWARLGDDARANEALAKAQGADKGAILHAQAVLAARGGHKAKALALIKATRDASYSEWHALAKEPSFALLSNDERFRDLVRPKKKSKAR